MNYFKGKYIATPITSPNFINLEPFDINKGIAECVIKVFYLGENRNGTFINAQTAKKIATTLRGSPIVGYFNEEEKDFEEHNREITINEQGELELKNTTIPYGFVSPNADVWFQDFKEVDTSTNEVHYRTYLMTKGYIWQKQYEAAQEIVNDMGKGQSMELDPDNLQGHREGDFFVITDASITELCILGDDVEPCFETASIVPKNTNTNFSFKNIDDNFSQMLYSMKNELIEILLGKGGNDKMEEKDVQVTAEEVKTTAEEPTFSSTETEAPQEEKVEEKVAEEETKVEEKSESKDDVNGNETKEKSEETNSDNKEDAPVLEEPASAETFSLQDFQKEIEELKTQLLDAQASYSKAIEDNKKLQEELASLRDFKNQIDSKAKDSLIEKFFSLSDEEKKDVIENKDKYSLEEIESKLSVIYTRKCLEEKEEEEVKENAPVTYTLGEEAHTSDLVAALRKAKKKEEI